jgi:hypothetical protein
LFSPHRQPVTQAESKEKKRKKKEERKKYENQMFTRMLHFLNPHLEEIQLLPRPFQAAAQIKESMSDTSFWPRPHRLSFFFILLSGY